MTNDDDKIKSNMRQIMIGNSRIGAKGIAKVLGLSSNTVVRHYMKIKKELSERRE